MMNRYKIIADVFVLISLIVGFRAGIEFKKMHESESIYPGAGVTRIAALSDYFSKIKNTRGDTEVYLFEGEKLGATVFILGGTHPNEPAGSIAAVCLIENIKVTQGRRRQIRSAL